MINNQIKLNVSNIIFQNNTEGSYYTSTLYKLFNALWFYFRLIDVFIKCQRYECNVARTHNQLVHKRTLNLLAKLAK